jgi:hypothetical protein
MRNTLVRTSFLLLLSLVFLFFSSPISAIESESTENFQTSYQVVSSPESPAQIEVNTPPQKDAPTSLSALTNKELSQNTSNQEVNGSKENLLQGTVQMYDSLKMLLSKLMQYLSKNGIFLFYAGSILALFTSLILFNIVSPTLLFYLKDLVRSGINLEVRALLLLSALIIFFKAGTPIQTAFELQVQNFTSYTGWQLNGFWTDLALIGGSVLFLIGCFFGPELIAGLKSFTLPSITIVPTLQKIGRYTLKETKSAFTETEKECKEREDGCQDPLDKAIILLFNYLPGPMPDLGIDDFIINLKNSLLKPHSAA